MSRYMLLMVLGLMLTTVNLHAEKTDVDQNAKAQSDQTEQTTKGDSDAKQNEDPENISGEVTVIDGDKITVQDTDKKDHTFTITGFQDLMDFRGDTLEKGDRVIVIQKDGEPYALTMTEEVWTFDLNSPDIDITGASELMGKVTEVSDDTIKMKDKEGTEHTLNITGLAEIEGEKNMIVEEGDRVVVNVKDEVTFAVSKVVYAWLLDVEVDKAPEAEDEQAAKTNN